MSNHKSTESLPFVVCTRCAGHGNVANPAFDGMSTSEMYDDMGYDETHEFLTEYTKRGGMYDILCPACNGKNVVKAECKCSDCEADRQELADMYEMEAAERRFGC